MLPVADDIVTRQTTIAGANDKVYGVWQLVVYFLL